MTTPSYRWEWSNRPRRLVMTGQGLNRWQAYRLSRSFDGVGVAIPAPRLRQITAGAAVTDDEFTDVNFALAVTHIMRQERHAKYQRVRRRCTRCLLFVGLVLVAMNLLMCMAYAILIAIPAASPF